MRKTTVEFGTFEYVQSLGTIIDPRNQKGLGAGKFWTPHKTVYSKTKDDVFIAEPNAEHFVILKIEVN